ncbi:MAG: anthranilate/aminodeoxychorismate synthase component II [Gammaproteobacteria bacterium]|nr:anthranilate/aminodeoxychorismate synthase component II [Gammaproteobacteria bacterium]
MLLMIDNYDSFTYNLVHYLEVLGEDVRVYRNDKITLEQIEELAPSRVVISPGPCTPDESGISVELIRHFKNRLPILGVCLGHQGIAQAFGAKIVHAGEVMHGKTSEIVHSKCDIFKDLDMPFTATRYHSLVIEKETLPDCFEISAWTEDSEQKLDEIMGIRHKKLPIYGVQFHPESILTSSGHQLLQNFLDC